MPRADQKPKASSSATARAAGPIFDKTLGQHILKNPLVVNGIVDKVCSIGQSICEKQKG
jgi:18S rRNA (adenine1779-N6/adenine1780-N6)-dimethyltransferase